MWVNKKIDEMNKEIFTDMRQKYSLVLNMIGIVSGLMMLLTIIIGSSAHALIQRSFKNLSFEDQSISSIAPCRVYAAVDSTHTTSVPGWLTTHPNASSSAAGNRVSGCTAIPGVVDVTSIAPIIEVWQGPRTDGASPAHQVSAVTGSQFIELNAEVPSSVYQAMCFTVGESFNWKFSHRGRSGTDVAKFTLGGTLPAGSPYTINGGTTLQTATSGNTAWSSYSGTYTVPSGLGGSQFFGFSAVSAASGDNALGNFLDDIQAFLKPAVEFKTSNYTQVENAATQNMAVQVVGIVPAGGTSLNFTIDPSSTAVIGTDYTINGGNSTSFNIVIPAGDYSNGTTITVPVQVLNNNIVDGSRFFKVNLTPDASRYSIMPTNACTNAAGNSSSTYAIQDDDIGLKLNKTWVNATVNDKATLTTTGGGTGASNISTVSNADTANETDSSNTIILAAGDSRTLAETLNPANTGSYSASAWSCTGGTLSGSVLTTAIADYGTTISCTITNTRNTTLQVAKAWGAGSSASDSATVPATTGGSANTTGFSTAGGTSQNSNAVTITVGNTITFAAETGTNIGNYNSVLSCLAGGGTTANSLSGTNGKVSNTLVIAAADVGKALVCTYTNTPKTTTLQVAKAWGAGSPATDSATVPATTGGTNNTTSFSTAGGTAADSGTAVAVSVGNTITLPAETGTNIVNYKTVLGCLAGGGATANSLSGTNGQVINTLVIGAADLGKAIVCTYTNAKLPTVTLTKVSINGTSSFDFTGTNGFGSENIVTTSFGVGVTGSVHQLTAAATSTVITETLLSGYTVTGISCSGLGAGGTATNNLAAGTVTLNAAATATGSDIACTYTNTANTVSGSPYPAELACNAAEVPQRFAFGGANTWPSGTSSKGFTIGTAPNSVTLTFTNTQSAARIAGDPSLQTLGNVANALQLSSSGGLSTGSLITTFGLATSRSINKLSHSIYDSDYSNNNFQDRTISTTNAGLPTSITPQTSANETITLGSGTATATTSASCGSTSANCNLYLAYNRTGITSETMQFRTAHSSGNSTQQYIGVSEYAWCLPSQPKVMLTKTSQGSTGTFNFTNTNLTASTTAITTATAGVAVAAATTNVSTVNSNVIIQETAQSGWTATAASCTDANTTFTGNPASFGTLTGNTLTIPATNVRYGADINCSFTNRKSAQLTLIKTWVNANLNDAVNVTATGLTSLTSIANTANETDTATAQTVYAADAITLGETFTTGSSANYTSALSCTGNTTALVGNVLTVNAADTAITCTYTNTLAGTDLVITKTGTTSTKAGQQVSYTIKAWNKGLIAVTDAVITDLVPSNLSGISIQCTAVGTATCGTIVNSPDAAALNAAYTAGTNTRTATGVSLPIDATGNTNYVTYTVTGLAYATGTFTNTATIGSPTIGELDNSNNSASQTTTITTDAPITTGNAANQCLAAEASNVITPTVLTTYNADGTAASNTDSLTAAVNSAGTGYGTATNGGIVLNGKMSWSYGNPIRSGSTLTIQVNGTDYGVLTTPGASSNGTPDTSGGVATFTALNGATVSPATFAVSYAGQTNFTVTLPTTITSIVTAKAVYLTVNPLTPKNVSADDFKVSIDSALQCLKPIVNIAKTSNGGTGTFSFNTLTNLSNSAGTAITTDSVTTVTAATPANSAQTNYATALATDVKITEAAATNYVLNSLTCTDANSAITGNTGIFASLSGSTATINAAAIKYAANILCTFTNTKQRNLTLKKTWVNANVNDAATVTATGLTSLSAVAGTANETDSATAQLVNVGNVVTLGETITKGTGNYNAVLSCTKDSDNSVVVVNGSNQIIIPNGDVSCTYTNTRKSASLTIVKKWVNALNGDTATVSVPASLSSATSGLSTSTGNNTTTGTAVTVFAGTSGAITEVLSNSANYTATLACTGTSGLVGTTLTVGAADTAITCTQTNTRKSASLTIVKKWVNALNGDTATVSVPASLSSATSGLSTSTGNNTTTGTAVTVFAGTSGAITEVLNNSANYTATLACTGTSGLVGNTLTVGAADTAITCTQTNTRKTSTLQVAKAWGANSSASDSATVGATTGGSSNTTAFTTAGGTNANSGTAVAITVGNTITFPAETGTNITNYNTVLSCLADGGATANSLNSTNGQMSNTLVIGAADAGKAIVCSYTNTRKSTTFRLAKAWGANSTAGNVANLGVTTGLTNNTAAFTSTANTPTNGVAVTVYAGETATLPAEAMSVGTLANYNTVISCNAGTLSGTNGQSTGNTIAFTAVSTATNPITCTYTNTPISAVSVTGRVFNDNSGSTGSAAAAYNGVQDAGEVGIQGSTVALTNCSSTTVATTTTNAGGDYTFSIPPASLPTPKFCVVETNVSGYTSVSGTSGYSRATDTITISNSGATSYANNNFGDAQLGLILLEDGQQTITAGAAADYPHRLSAQSVLSLDSLAVTYSQQPANSADQAWQNVVYRDSNCNGKVDSGEVLLSTTLPLTIQPNQDICLVQRVYAPSNASSGAQHLGTLQASFSVDLTAPTQSITAQSNLRQDTTLIGGAGLSMQKGVRTVASCPSTGADTAIFSTQNQAKNSNFLEYEIIYRNNSTKNLVDVKVKDSIPTGTLFQSMQCTVTPSPITSCMPSRSNDALVWQTVGLLAPSGEGRVRFCIQIP